MGAFDFLKHNLPLKIENITGMLVALHVANRQTLFVMLGVDGLVNRLGTGAEDNVENDMFIGKASLDTFNTLRSRINPDIFQWIGEHADPAPVGKICRLAVGFQLKDGRELMSEWQYGSQSLGPPPEVRDFVIAAVEITDPWYEQQKLMVQGG